MDLHAKHVGKSSKIGMALPFMSCNGLGKRFHTHPVPFSKGADFVKCLVNFELPNRAF